jgi:hypothetical protein
MNVLYNENTGRDYCSTETVFFFVHSLLKKSRAIVVLSYRYGISVPATSLLLIRELVVGSILPMRRGGGTFPVYTKLQPAWARASQYSTNEEKQFLSSLLFFF